MVVQPTDLIASILKNVRELNDGAEDADDEEYEAKVILIHGEADDPNMLMWTGPFALDDVEKELEDSWELLAGAAIVFEGHVAMERGFHPDE